jgi:hypothetical protein
VTGKAAVEMRSKVFYMVLFRYLHIIYMDRWARFASRSERHMDRLSFISFHTPSVQIRIHNSDLIPAIRFLKDYSNGITWGHIDVGVKW